MRPAEKHDIYPSMCRLLDMLRYSPAPQMKMADSATALGALRRFVDEGRAVFVGDFLILYDIGKPWYSNEQVLIEELILRVYRTHKNRVEDAIDALTELAVQHNCRAICAGDTQIGYMRPKYEAAGYVPMGFQLLKGL